MTYDLFNIPEWDTLFRSAPSVSRGGGTAERETPASSGSGSLSASGNLPRKADAGYPAYHDTVPGVDVLIASFKALGQEARIETFFRGSKPNAAFTPSQVHRYVGGNAPLTSTRRAMTGLERAGVLVKTDVTRQGQYGRPEHAWRLAAETRRAA